MDHASLESIIVTGENILRGKRYILAFNVLWFWDYALTFKDEVNYCWKGRKSWAFVLFLLNRYWPLPYLIWVFISSWWPGYTQKACDKTALIETLFFSVATVFAQTTLTLRVYAVTQKNKVLAAIPGCISLIQFTFGICLWVRVSGAPTMRWPSIPLDAYRLCFFNEQRFLEVTVMSFSLAYDLLVFLIIVWVGRRPGGIRQPGIPSILDNIVKDSTIYFLVMFTSHLIVEFFILFASPNYRHVPANTVAILVPLMATRLMLSLKKAADNLGSFTRTDDVGDVTDALFAGSHTTMEHAMEVGVSTREYHGQSDAIDLPAVGGRL